MTTENVKQSIKEWIASQVANHPEISGIPVYLSGESADEDPPFIGIIDQGSATAEQAGVIMYGVEEVGINVEIHTVPIVDDGAGEEGTSITTHRALEKALYRILADRNSIDYLNGRNETTIFDIRAAGPTIEADQGRRVSTIQMLVIACPLNP